MSTSNAPRYDAIQIGQELPPMTFPPITRTTLALFAGASGDHNPIHIDLDFARAAGMPDVFAHGMLSMALLGRYLTHWAPQPCLRRFGVRFVAITPVGTQLRCSGKVVDRREEGGERLVALELVAADLQGEAKLIGEALVALP
ncbi:MaoC family dehydratase [Tepidiphilus olei]|uniref:MaoC family dehydratase n=1 Tax=Tepidiphilus olei TaxID=2502184 RepID=UPI00115CFDDB|nr:MaoC family dehydratase [Tepidiphilus olei]